MKVAQSVAEVLREHVTWELESIDRMYLNLYVPRLQCEQGVSSFFRFHRGQPWASSALMAPITEGFVAAMDRYCWENEIPLVSFEKGQRKEDVAAQYRAQRGWRAGIYLVGKAQEKARVCRTQKRRNPVTGQAYPWLVSSTAMVNHYYFYGQDEDFGPFFLKFCSYFPYNGKVCLNGHEYLKRQLEQKGVAFEALDNGLLSCADTARAQKTADGLSAEKIERLVRKWLRLLPHPFTAKDRLAGYRYDLSILQAELSLTQVLDAPVSGRIFFEQVIRENLDMGRPDQVQLIFGRRVGKTTPG